MANDKANDTRNTRASTLSQISATPWRSLPNTWAQTLSSTQSSPNPLSSRSRSQSPAFENVSEAFDQRTQATLLTLPSELREMIYKNFLPGKTIGSHDITRGPWSTKKRQGEPCGTNNFPALVRTCGQIHDELGPMVYDKAEIWTGGSRFDRTRLPHRAADLLKTIGSNIRHIQHLSLCYMRPQVTGRAPSRMCARCAGPRPRTQRSAPCASTWTA